MLKNLKLKKTVKIIAILAGLATILTFFITYILPLFYSSQANTREPTSFPNNKSSSSSTGILIKGGSNNYLGDNIIIGFDKGIDVENSTNLTVINNTIK